MESRNIVFLLSGPAHAPYLCAALWTLRKHWRGPIRVFAWPESIDIAWVIGRDGRLDAEVIPRKPMYRRKNAQFLDKITLFQTFDPNDVYLYLDCDTTINGDVSPIFADAEAHGFCATQFNDWTTKTGRIRKRIEDLRKFPEINQGLVDDALQYEWPSVNGGVWAAMPDSPVLPLWEEWSLAARRTFICDEKVLHLMMPRFYSEGKMTVAMGNGKFNCSPKFQSKLLADEDVVVRHFHGDSCCRPDNKSRRGWELWRPIYRECLELNVGRINGWIGKIKNRFLKQVSVDE